MRERPAFVNAALMCENGREPKNPWCAESGEGCGASMTAWREVSMSAFFFRA